MATGVPDNVIPRSEVNMIPEVYIVSNSFQNRQYCIIATMSHSFFFLVVSNFSTCEQYLFFLPYNGKWAFHCMNVQQKIRFCRKKGYSTMVTISCMLSKLNCHFMISIWFLNIAAVCTEPRLYNKCKKEAWKVELQCLKHRCFHSPVWFWILLLAV